MGQAPIPEYAKRSLRGARSGSFGRLAAPGFSRHQARRVAWGWTRSGRVRDCASGANPNRKRRSRCDDRAAATTSPRRTAGSTERRNGPRCRRRPQSRHARLARDRARVVRRGIRSGGCHHDARARGIEPDRTQACRACRSRRAPARSAGTEHGPRGPERVATLPSMSRRHPARRHKPRYACVGRRTCRRSCPRESVLQWERKRQRGASSTGPPQPAWKRQRTRARLCEFASHSLSAKGALLFSADDDSLLRALHSQMARREPNFDRESDRASGSRRLEC